jgi:hypothetical protein
MAANNPVVEKIIAACKQNMQFYCDTYNDLFEIGTSYVKINTSDIKTDDETDDEDKLFFLGKHILLGGKHSRNYLIAAGSMKSNINFLDIDKGKFLITTYDSSNPHYLTGNMTTTEIIDGPLMIAVRVNDKYHFVGLAIMGAENKIGIFSIIKDLSNGDLKKELLDAEGSHIHCFKDENRFFNNDEFKPGIGANERGHAAAEIRRLEELCTSKKKQLKIQEKIKAIKEALEKNSPEKLYTLLEKNDSSFCNFFVHKKKYKLCENLVYRSLSK